MSWVRQFIVRAVTAAWEAIVLGTLAAYYIAESTVINFTPWFLRTHKSLKGKVVLITGGAGGLGQELALRLARVKAKVVVWDINEKGLYIHGVPELSIKASRNNVSMCILIIQGVPEVNGIHVTADFLGQKQWPSYEVCNPCFKKKSIPVSKLKKNF